MRRDSERTEYEHLVDRVHAAIRASIPRGSIVLIASKGDERLVELPGWRCQHFPQDNVGRYPGFYPADSSVAIEQLEQLRDNGAAYLLFPSSAAWWLSHYQELAQHLASKYTVVVDEPDTCVIHALADPPANRLASFLDSLLASDTGVAVVTGGRPELLSLDRPAFHLLRGDSFDSGATAAAALEHLASEGTRFLVVPREARDWLERHPDFLREVQARYAVVAERRHLCTVFDLTRAPRDEGAVGRPATRTPEGRHAGVESDGSGTGLVAKLRKALLRRPGKR